MGLYIPIVVSAFSHLTQKSNHSKVWKSVLPITVWAVKEAVCCNEYLFIRFTQQVASVSGSYADFVE